MRINLSMVVRKDHATPVFDHIMLHLWDETSLIVKWEHISDTLFTTNCGLKLCNFFAENVYFIHTLSGCKMEVPLERLEGMRVRIPNADGENYAFLHRIAFLSMKTRTSIEYLPIMSPLSWRIC